MKTVVFDLDGVLADFSKAFTLLASETFGTSQVSDLTQVTWDYTEILNEDQREWVWELLKKTPEWWTTLSPLVGLDTFSRIEMLTDYNEMYFVTNRFSSMRPPGEQTVTWLKDWGIINPRVIVSSRKGEIARAIKADYVLEDNWGNACAIHWMAEGCQTFLIRRGYNQEARMIIPNGIAVVDSVDEFLNEVERGITNES